MNDEFIYITPLSVFGTVLVGTGALVSNNVPLLFDDSDHISCLMPAASGMSISASDRRCGTAVWSRLHAGSV